MHSHDHGGCLRFHSVIARRRYTGSSATADSADCCFGDMAREREGRREGGREGVMEGGSDGGREGGREGGRGGEGRGGEGRGGDCPHFPQTRTFVTAEPSRPPAKRVTG